MPSAGSPLLVSLTVAVVLSVTLSAAQRPQPQWPALRSMPFAAPLLMGYLRPRRAPMPARPPPGGSLGGLSSYPPARTLTFNGYFSGAGIPQSDNPYSFSWGPAVRSYQDEELSLEGLKVATPAATLAPASEEPQDSSRDLPADESLGTETPTEGGDAFDFEARGQPADGPTRNSKPPKPSYPVSNQPHPHPQPTQHPASPDSGDNGSWSGADDDNRDRNRGGYGTINAYFPFVFGGGGMPAGPHHGQGQGQGPRGYGAPSPPHYGESGSASGSNSGSGDHGGSGGSSSPHHPSQTSAATGGGHPYYPVAIANSFSTGRNAMASSTATAYGGPSPSRQ